MPRKKTVPAAGPKIELPEELLKQLIPGPMAAGDLEAVFRNFKKAFIERALGAELGVHLEGPEGAAVGNHRNGRSGKTVLTDDGPVRVEVPRDRAGTFEPQLIPKHERRFNGFDDKIATDQDMHDLRRSPVLCRASCISVPRCAGYWRHRVA